MATNGTPTQYSNILANSSHSLVTGSYDTRYTATSSWDTYYWYLITAPSFRVYINAAYKLSGSDHLRVAMYRYSLSSNSWVQCVYYNYLDGGGGNSGTKTMWIAVNLNRTESAADNNYNLSYSDSIHYCVALYNITYGLGWHWNGESYINIYIGDYNTCSRYSYMPGTLVYGKNGNSATSGCSFRVNGGSSISPSYNPLNQTWGSLTTATGSIITSSDKYQALSTYGYSV